MANPSSYLLDYLEAQGVELPDRLKNIADSDKEYAPGVDAVEEMQNQKSELEIAFEEENNNDNVDATTSSPSTDSSNQQIIFE